MFYSLIYGIICGFVYDLFLSIKNSINSSKKILFITDFIFVIFVSLIILSVAYTTNYGNIRAYAICSSFSAFVIYRLSIGKFLYLFEVTLICKLKNIICHLFNILKLVLDISVKFVKIIMVNCQLKNYKRKLMTKIATSFSGKETYGEYRE